MRFLAFVLSMADWATASVIRVFMEGMAFVPAVPVAWSFLASVAICRA